MFPSGEYRPKSPVLYWILLFFVFVSFGVIRSAVTSGLFRYPLLTPTPLMYISFFLLILMLQFDAGLPMSTTVFSFVIFHMVDAIVHSVGPYMLSNGYNDDTLIIIAN